MNDLIKPENLSLSGAQLSMLLPYAILVLGGMATMLVGVARKGRHSNGAVMGTALLTLLAAIYSVSSIWGEPGTALFNGMLAADYFSNLFNVVFLIASALVVCSSYNYLEREGMHHFEYYTLLLFSCVGMMLLASSLDLIVLFISLEIMSISVYVLVGFRRTDTKSNEAALKYFILGGAASAVLLYGIAFLYGATGTLNIIQIANALKGGLPVSPMLGIGTVMLLVGFLFKVATVPFHMWMPDVYEGAPTTVTNFMTTALKAAAFAAFIRVFMSVSSSVGNVGDALNHMIHNALWGIAVATMFFGNILALVQKNIKRMLAYSSIAHSGYIMVGFLAAGAGQTIGMPGRSPLGFSPVIVYLVGYVVMNLGAFAVITLLAEKNDTRTNIEDFSGLGFKRPFLGAAMALFMFSMTGIPPTIGFAGKYLIFSSAVQAGEVWLAVLAVLCSAISAYYYLRVIVFMYMRDASRELPQRLSFGGMLVIIAMAATTIGFGMFPNMLINAAKKAILVL